MSFPVLVLKNLWRNKARTALTLIGISIGIATILMLGAVASGLEDTVGAVLESGGSDFTVAQANVSDLTFSSLTEQQLEELAQRPGVGTVEGVLLTATRFGSNPFFVLFGIEGDSSLGADLHYAKGRAPSDLGEIAVGKIAASGQGLGLGDEMTLLNEPFTVVGVYESGDNLKDGGGIMGLGALQALLDREGTVTMAFVRAAEGADPLAVAAAIDDEYDGRLVTISSVDEVSRADQGIEIMNAASWAISALAVVIGGIGVMNTMIISVYDRIRELGVLKALGWRRRTVIRLILSEAALLGLASVGVGTLVALPILELVRRAPAVEAFLQPAYTPGLWLQATIVALLVALIGGAYPAYRAANLSPVEALRYE